MKGDDEKRKETDVDRSTGTNYLSTLNTAAPHPKLPENKVLPSCQFNQGV
jgi:hypothetical protein